MRDYHHQHRSSKPQHTPRVIASTQRQPFGLLELQRIVGNQIVQRTLIEPRSAPVWGAEDNVLGGSSMTAIIGAEKGQGDFGLPTAGSAPAADTPQIIKRVGKASGLRYIAGHLLNNVLGGPGVNNNLTVLSKDANTLHSGKETKLKNIGAKASLADRQSAQAARLNGGDAYLHGARYTVTVNGASPGRGAVYAAEQRLAESITLKTEPIRQKENDNQLQAWNSDPQVNQWAADATTTVKNVPPYPQSLGPYDQHANKHHKKAIKNLTGQQRQILHQHGVALGANAAAVPSPKARVIIKKIKREAKNMAMGSHGVVKQHKGQTAFSATKLVPVTSQNRVTTRIGRPTKRINIEELKKQGLL